MIKKLILKRTDSKNPKVGHVNKAKVSLTDLRFKARTLLEKHTFFRECVEIKSPQSIQEV